MNVIAILLIIGLIYISIKQKNESSRNMMLLMTGLLFFCMMTKIEGYCTIPADYLTDSDSDLITDDSAESALASLDNYLQNPTELLTDCGDVGEITFARTLKQATVELCINDSPADSSGNTLDDNSFHCSISQEERRTLGTTHASVREHTCGTSGLDEQGACGVGRIDGDLPPEEGYKSENLRIYKERPNAGDHIYYSTGHGDGDDPAFLDACCVPDIQCEDRPFKGGEGELGCEDVEGEGVRSKMNPTIHDARVDYLTFDTKCDATEDVVFTDDQREHIAQLAKDIHEITAPTQDDSWLFGTDETPKDWCFNLTDKGSLPEALNGVCPQPCVTLQNSDPFRVNESICEWHQDWPGDPEDYLGSLFYGQWPLGQCGKKDKTRHRPDPVHCSAEVKIISEYKYHNKWVTGGVFVFLVLFWGVIFIDKIWPAVEGPPIKVPWIVFFLLVAFIISAFIIALVGWWVGVSQYDN